MQLPIVLDREICVSEECHLRYDCAQHVTAGEIREESGFRPDIKFDGSYRCGGIREFDDDDLWGITYESYGIISLEDLIEIQSDFLYDPIYHGG